MNHRLAQRKTMLVVVGISAIVALVIGTTAVNALTTNGSQQISQTQITGSVEVGDYFAASLAIGDFNNDGFGDVIAGAPFENCGKKADVGIVHVIYGSSNGLNRNNDDTIHQGTTGVISETILDHWGLQFRPPWTAEGFAGVVHALGEGFYLRNRVDPGVANLEIFELTLLSLLPTVAMRVGGEDVDVREHLERFAEDVSSSWRTNTAAVPVDNAYERVIRAFRAELTNRGLDKVTINAVSKRSQLSPALISSNFGGIPALLRASVFDSLPSLREEAQFDLTSVSLTTDDVLLRHLTRVGSWMADHPELVRAVIALGAIGAPDTAERQLTKDVVHELSAPAAIILASGVHRGDRRPRIGSRRCGIDGH